MAGGEGGVEGKTESYFVSGRTPNEMSVVVARSFGTRNGSSDCCRRSEPGYSGVAEEKAWWDSADRGGRKQLDRTKAENTDLESHPLDRNL